MTNAFRYSLFTFLGALLMLTGCASKKTTTKQINALQAQVGALTEEVTRLDQSLQEVRSGSQEGAARQAASPRAAIEGGSRIYRTPSGFELPSVNIQKALKRAGYYQGTVDGKIGSATKEAVKAFQKDNGLEADGVVGRRTWEKLRPFLDAAGTTAAIK